MNFKDSCKSEDDLDSSLTITFNDSLWALKVVQKTSEPYKLSLLRGGIATNHVEYFKKEGDLMTPPLAKARGFSISFVSNP